MKTRVGILVACLGVGTACGDQARDESGAFSGGGGVETDAASANDPATSGAGSATPGEGEASSGDEGDEGGVKLDVGSGSEPVGGCMGPDASDCSCTAVDILFVVDNSLSMDEHKPAVVAAFDPFVEQMVDVLPPGTSLHVGLTRATGFYNPGNASSWNPNQGCVPASTDGQWSPPDQWNSGINGQQGRLYEHDGARYFEFDTSADPAGLETWFEGALSGAIAVDNHSNTESVVAGAAYPFHPVNAEYNAGFLRQQAVLVLFLLSDAPEMAPGDVPASHFVQLVSDAKAECGDFCILTTGAIAQACYDPGIENPRIHEFMNGFGSAPPSYAGIGIGQTPNFEDVLGTALSAVIAETCDEIQPEG